MNKALLNEIAKRPDYQEALDSEMQPSYASAFKFAQAAHDGQTYGDGVPYSKHFIDVSVIAMSCSIASKADHNFALVIGVLHDVIEDTDVDFYDITANFGLPVAAAVKALSKDPNVPTDQQMDKVLEQIALEPREVAIVKMADRYCNLRSIQESWSTKKAIRYMEESEKIADRLGGASDCMYQKLVDQIAIYRIVIANR